MLKQNTTEVSHTFFDKHADKNHHGQNAKVQNLCQSLLYQIDCFGSKMATVDKLELRQPKTSSVKHHTKNVIICHIPHPLNF